MAVGNSMDDLLEVDARFLFFERFFFPEKSEKLAAFQIFHNHDNFHVAKCITVDNLDDIRVIESFEVFGLTENHVDVGRWGIFIWF